jgi:hypothetical protein
VARRGRARKQLWRTRAYAFRLPDELIVRLDAHVERMKATFAGVEVSRTTALRSLLTTALDAVERSSAHPAPPR